jgi:flagellar biogenesis protein FliO
VRVADEAETVKQEASASNAKFDAQQRVKLPAAEGLAGWLLARLRRIRRVEPRLVVLERITLAPRQSLALVEAEGRRFLVATSPEGTPAFHALESMRVTAPARTPNRTMNRNQARREALAVKRVSW